MIETVFYITSITANVIFILVTLWLFQKCLVINKRIMEIEEIVNEVMQDTSTPSSSPPPQTEILRERLISVAVAEKKK